MLFTCTPDIATKVANFPCVWNWLMFVILLLILERIFSSLRYINDGALWVYCISLLDLWSRVWKATFTRFVILIIEIGRCYLEYYGLNKVKMKEKGTQNSISRLEFAWQKVGFQDKTSFYGILLMIINIKNMSKVTFDCINSELRHIVTKETMKILIIFALASTISGRFLPKRAFNPWN